MHRKRYQAASNGPRRQVEVIYKSDQVQQTAGRSVSKTQNGTERLVLHAHTSRSCGVDTAQGFGVSERKSMDFELMG